jgi:predicted transcriptional regulator
MGILVNPHSEQEEKTLIAFLDSMKYDYKADIEDTEAFIEQYNKEIDEAEAEIEAGNYLTHAEVELMFAERRKKLNAD